MLDQELAHCGVEWPIILVLRSDPSRTANSISETQIKRD